MGTGVTNTALIAKLEKAPEGSRALSDEVLLALGWTQYRMPNWKAGRLAWKKPDGRGAGPEAADPTRNLQDVVDLVPEGWFWRVGVYSNRRPSAIITKADGVPPTKWSYAPDAATPTLALCIAILRAMEAADA